MPVTTLDRWQPLDLGSEPRPPEWLVQDVLARGWITLWGGPPGAGKSYVYQGLVGAAMAGGDWLGRPISGLDRILAIDEENPGDVAIRRLRGFDVGPEHAGRLRYYNQLGVRLGSGAWADELQTIASEFRPDLIVLDSVSSALAVNVNENDSISETFSSVLRPLAKRGSAVLVLHHDRKAGGDVAERVLGGVQWIGQVDRQVAFEAQAKRPATWATSAGTTRASFPIRLSDGKARDGVGLPTTDLTIESEMNPDGTYRWMRLDLTPKGGDAAPAVRSLAARIAEVLATEMQRQDVAAAVNVDASSSTLEKALKWGAEHGLFRKAGHGRYGPTESFSPKKET